ncbi:hypothetical protein ACNSOL_11930 (plasmid) [Aliarcobacter lanthieri]|uniref:hypothetical protein n=1 Tax=Aliarcobacter lanthieri TaxID=1355374 RepID=UPI003AABA916
MTKVILSSYIYIYIYILLVGTEAIASEKGLDLKNPNQSVYDFTYESKETKKERTVERILVEIGKSNLLERRESSIYSCKYDELGNEYCPSNLVKADSYWDYEDGYSVTKVGQVLDYGNKIENIRYNTATSTLEALYKKVPYACKNGYTFNPNNPIRMCHQWGNGDVLYKSEWRPIAEFEFVESIAKPNYGGEFEGDSCPNLGSMVNTGGLDKLCVATTKIRINNGKLEALYKKVPYACNNGQTFNPNQTMRMCNVWGNVGVLYKSEWREIEDFEFVESIAKPNYGGEFEGDSCPNLGSMVNTGGLDKLCVATTKIRINNGKLEALYKKVPYACNNGQTFNPNQTMRMCNVWGNVGVLYKSEWRGIEDFEFVESIAKPNYGGEFEGDSCPNLGSMVNTGGLDKLCVATTKIKGNITCPTGTVLEGNRCKEVIISCPQGYEETTGSETSRGECRRVIDYSYYEYKCKDEKNEQGYNYTATNSGGNCNKIDTNNTTANPELSNSCNNTTPPTNNCKREGFKCNTNERKAVYVDNEWRCSPYLCNGDMRCGYGTCKEGTKASKDKYQDLAYHPLKYLYAKKCNSGICDYVENKDISYCEREACPQGEDIIQQDGRCYKIECPKGTYLSGTKCLESNY